ncbi:hypothetical protein PORY_001607 [Pneumocystis oryctolagi]|uniref:Uncharacterized protein n=1 Tax=Pneumocystis oryctolagi TaxID=42067 RepID=A0ACB7CEL3_9ASCO|nr:hypothetical protein PORY_001607 [Pneumocystis oryctolagi]
MGVSPVIPPRPTPLTEGKYPPKIQNLSSGETVYQQRILLVYGRAGSEAMADGWIVVYHDKNSFPEQTWPCTNSHFKCLVHLNPGLNRISFVFYPPQNTCMPPSSSVIFINYVNVIRNPPLYLAIILAKDSPGEYDAPPLRKEREGNGLELAIKKFRMIAYLWQAFTGEQMARNGFERRCFRFEEEKMQDTLSYKERNVFRQTAKIHIIRSKYTLREIRDIDLAQQNPTAKRKCDLFGKVVYESLKEYGGPFASHYPVHVAACILDSHWDGRTILGHAALGGNSGMIKMEVYICSMKLAVFGSHSMHSFPSCMEEIVPTFLDDTPIDTRYVANDNNESSTNWECANVGIGAFLHEVGHLLGCPHRVSGIMRRDYVNFNRTFCTREPYSVRTKKRPWGPCLPESECAWHRLDIIRFRYHTLFSLPSDPPINNANLFYYATNNGFHIVSNEGVVLIEIYVGEQCYKHIEFCDSPQKSVILEEHSLRDYAGISYHAEPLRIVVISATLREIVIENFKKELSNSIVSLIIGKGVRSAMLGQHNPKSSEFKIDFSDKLDKLTKICVRSGLYLDGVELFFNDKSSMALSGRGGTLHTFLINGAQGERIQGFYIWSDAWVDAIQIITNWNRISPIYGTPSGLYKYIAAPQGYLIAGIYGSIGAWCNSFGFFYIDTKLIKYNRISDQAGIT